MFKEVFRGSDVGDEDPWWQKKRVRRDSRGIFDPAEWIKSGDGLFASALVLRDELTKKREELRALGERTGHPSEELMDQVLGMPRASLLLLGYTVEMYLKACLAYVYVGCPEELLERDLKRLSHDFSKLAAEVEFRLWDPSFESQDSEDVDSDERNPLQISDREGLELLKRMVLNDGRYPLTPDADRCEEKYRKRRNQLSAEVANDDLFEALCDLADRIRQHGLNLRGTRFDPMTFRLFVFDDDGYLAYRTGGGLKPRITLKLSTVMLKDLQVAPERLRDHFSQDSNLYWHPLMIWDSATLRYHGKKGAVTLKNWDELRVLTGL